MRALCTWNSTQTALDLRLFLQFFCVSTLRGCLSINSIFIFCILVLSCSHVLVDNPFPLVDRVSLNSCLKIFSAEITQEIQRIQHSCFKWPSLQLKWPRSNTSSRDNSKPSAPTVRNIASLAARVLLFHSDVVFEEKSAMTLRHIQETYVHRCQYDLVASYDVHSFDL